MTEGSLTLQSIVAAGLVPTLVAATATDGDAFPNNGNVFFLVKNGSGGSINVTIDAYPTGNTTPKPDGLTVTDRVIAVANGAEALIGPFPPSIYNRPADNKVKATCSVVTTVTIAAITMVANPN